MIKFIVNKFTISLLLILIVSGFTLSTYKLNGKIKTLYLRIDQLETQLSITADNSRKMLSFSREGTKFSERCDPSRFNCLVIGNSITKHGKCDYWWGEYGMAASKLSNDYFHLLDQMFKSGG